MTLEQQLSGPVLKTQEQILEERLIDLVGSKEAVIKIEKQTKKVQYIHDLFENDNSVHVWDSEHRLSYVAVINSALANKADKLIIINNGRLSQEEIRRKINDAMKDGLVKQVRDILSEKDNYKLCPISVYDSDLKPKGKIEINY